MTCVRHSELGLNTEHSTTKHRLGHLDPHCCFVLKFSTNVGSCDGSLSFIVKKTIVCIFYNKYK